MEDPLECETLKQIYTLRLKKYSRGSQLLDSALQYLGPLGVTSTAVALAQAERLFTECKYKASFQLTSSLVLRDPFNLQILSLHLILLCQLGMTNALFQLSNQLVEQFPNHAVSPFSIGMYYLSLDRYDEARKYFAKATLIDPLHGQAWIGFGHAFALDGEHDQAISAYSTAARILKGSHLPFLYIGMEHVATNNFSLAEQYMTEASRLCDRDPSLFIEFGVVYMHLASANSNGGGGVGSNGGSGKDEKAHLEKALGFFEQAYELAVRLELDRKGDIFMCVQNNRAHVMRRLGRLREAREILLDRRTDASSARKVSGLGSWSNRQTYRSSGLFKRSDTSHLEQFKRISHLALVEHEMGNLQAAIELYHQALGYQPEDGLIQDLLSKALELYCSQSMAMPGVMQVEPFNDDGDNDLQNRVRRSKRLQQSF